MAGQNVDPSLLTGGRVVTWLDRAGAPHDATIVDVATDARVKNRKGLLAITNVVFLAELVEAPGSFVYVTPGNCFDGQVA